jgi:putative drug exporter of the RND superfamily
MRALARWCIAHRRLVIVGWVVALIAANVVGQAVGSSYNSNYKGQSSAGSQRAIDLLQQSFPQRKGDSASIVFDSKALVTSPQVKGEIDALLTRIASFPHVSGVVSPYAATASAVSPGGHIAYATVLFDERSFQLPPSSINRVIDTAEGARTPAFQIQLGGQPIEQVEPPTTGPATIIGVLAAIIILLITFGTVVAAGLPLITALLALGTAIGLIALLTHAFDVVNFTPELAAMIGLGVGIDYALFVVTRYRAALDAGVEPDEAIVTAMDTSGRAVLFAGVVVVVAMLGQLLVGVSFLRGPAVGSSLTVLLTMFAAITLLPAVLSKLGHGIDRWDPFGLRRRSKGRDGGFWERWAAMIERRPLVCALASLAILLVLASPILALRLGAADAGTDAKSTTTRQAYDLLAKGFGPGFNGPMQLVAKLPTPNDVAAVATLRSGLVGQPDVAKVAPAIYSPNGRLALINVVPKTAPRDAATSNLLSRLRDTLIPPLERQTHTTVYVGGTTALFADFSSYLASKLPLFIGAVVLLSALLLLVVFRSVFVAAKAIVMNLLSVAAAFGVVVAVFQWGWLGGLIGISTTSPIAAFLPVMVFAIVFGLSMDYEVFLMSRMHEEWERTGDAAHAVRHGLASTGRVITAAATIMVFVFLSFVLGDSLTIKLFGVGLASAVFLDAFLIRTVLVPSLMALMGPRAWWMPRGLARRLPHLNVDPGSFRPEDDAAAPEPV